MDVKIDAEKATKELQDMVQDRKESVMSDEQKKVFEDNQKKAQADQVKTDKVKAADDVILAKKEEERTQEEKDRAKTVIEERGKAEKKVEKDAEAKLPIEDKIKRVQEKSQQRINEMSNELKQLKDSNSTEAEALKVQIESLKVENENLNKRVPKPKSEANNALLLKQEKERMSQYLEEDKDKPREQRREMSKEDLDEWVLEDLTSATEWLVRQGRRKERESQTDKDSLSRQDAASEIMEAQKASLQKVMAKYPDLDVKARSQELRTQGKSEKEITDTILQENEKLRLLTEITKSDPKYLTAENGPELAMIEMEKRLTKSSANTEDKAKIDELTEKVEEMSAELASQKADEGITSSIPRVRISKEKLTEQEKGLVDMLKEAKAPQANIDSALKKFRTSKGINA